MIDRGFRYYPALKLAVPYAAGILLADCLASGPALPLALMIVGLGLLAVSRSAPVPLRLPALALMLVASGMLSFAVRADRSAGTPDGRADAAEVIGVVDAEPVARNGRVEILLRADSIFYGNVVAHPAGRLLARLPDTGTGSRIGLERGDRCAIEGSLAVPRGPVNPGAPDYAAALRARGVTLLLDADRASSLTRIGRADPGPVDRFMETIRRGARRFAERDVGGEEGDIVRALLLGEQQLIDQETRDAFMRTGTIHVLSVSGLHVGIIALGLFVIVSWIPDRRLQLPIFAAAIALYVVIAGAGPSIVRAAIMAVAFLAARTASRVARPLNTLGLAALVMLAADPAALFDLGFQLSFASVAGILILYAPMRSGIFSRAPWLSGNVLLRRIVEMLLLSVAAQLFTLPLIVHRFGYLSVGGLIANVAVVPLISLALGAAAVGALVSALPLPLASWFGASAYLAIVAAEKIVLWCAALPFAGVELRPFTAPGAAVLAAATLRLALALRPAQAALRSIAYVSILVSILLLDPFLDPLGRFDARSLALLACGRLTVVVTAGAGDSLRAVVAGASPRDSAVIARNVEWLRRRVGAAAARIVAIDSLDARDADLVLLTTRPRVAVCRGLPLLLTSTAQRRLRIVSAGGAPVLEVPMRAKLEEGLVARFNGQWEMIRWR
jgi:competence protein ComEC